MTLEARPFVPLGQYDTPSLPPQKAARRFLDRTRALISPPEVPPTIAASDLDRIGRMELDEVAAPPACGPLLDGLSKTFGAWIADPAEGRRLQLVVLPPGDETGILSAWSRQNGLDILHGPDPQGAPPDLSGEGVLLVPALEAWFRRRLGGLDAVRDLLAALAGTDRRCIVGCTSWAWPYLCTAVDAGAVLTAPRTFQSFDGARLQHWFGELAQGMEEIPAIFRLSGSGADVFAERAEGRQDYFVQLAARSLGIPWIAWRMWRDALRDAPEDGDAGRLDGIPQDDGRTYWIASPETFSLPLMQEEKVILTLHALLLHGGLGDDGLASVLPEGGAPTTVASLLRTGVVRRLNGTLRVNPVAYPSVREALSDAGINLDEL